MTKFDEYAPRIMARLAQDFHFTDPDDTAAIVGNLAHECNGFETLQEIKPTVKGSRGGYGWAQWTGPRRLQYEAWCARKGWKGDEFEANYSFLFRELTGPEAGALGMLNAAHGLAAKTEAFMNGYLRPGIPHLEGRIRWAQKARALLTGGDLSSSAIPAPESAFARFWRWLQGLFMNRS